MKKKSLEKKKAQANIITIVLIILISIVAVSIIWVVVSSLITRESEKIGAGHLTIGLEVKEVILFATGASKITVKRDASEGKIDSLKFVFYDDNGETRVQTKEENLPEQLETKTYYFSPNPEIGKIKSVSVVPIVKNNLGREFKGDAGNILEIPSGLVSWWRFDGNLDDFAGNNSCLFYGNLNFADSERGKVASFNGGYADCGDNENLNINNKFAISLWVKADSGVSGGLIKKGNNYEIKIKNPYAELSYTKDGVLNNFSSISEIADGEWHHLIVTEDWTGNKNLMFYIDGELDNMIQNLEVPEINNEDVLIGNFNGRIDEAMFFNS